MLFYHHQSNERRKNNEIGSKEPIISSKSFIGHQKFTSFECDWAGNLAFNV